MSPIPPARTPGGRARVHIKALITEAKHGAETTPAPAQMFFSGMLSGLAAAVEILDGGTAEGSMETMVNRLSAAIGQAYLDGQLPPQPDPPIGTEAPAAEADVKRVIDLYEQWVKAGPPRPGTSIAREWDRRLAELRAAIHGPADQTKEQ
ncbi:hypothetical protein ACFWWC_03655 [Streptomyces sp. NPDC058642]|uniref:hypothetical protein n=1 Tax=Streptomyces sp. NPDC058642 TaxID=3346572 RepID=UPI003652F6E0